jgi:D-alanine-D-alanine ligase
MSLRGLRITVAIDVNVSVAKRDTGFRSIRNAYDSDVVHTLKHLGADVEVLRVRHGDGLILNRLMAKKPNLVFNLALSTDRCEACWPATLEMIGVPFTGSGVQGLVLSGDKSLSRSILAAQGIPVPRYETFHPGQRVRSLGLGFPVLVKPNTLGGSIGIHRKSLATTLGEVRQLVAAIHDEFGVAAICDEYIDGREFVVPVLEWSRSAPRVLRPREFFFGDRPGAPRYKTERVKADSSYRRRWEIGSRPANLRGKVLASLRQHCQRAFQALQVRGYATIDCRLDSEGRLFLIEVNANPGIASSNSIWGDVPFPKLLERIVRTSLSQTTASNTAP